MIVIDTQNSVEEELQAFIPKLKSRVLQIIDLHLSWLLSCD